MDASYSAYHPYAGVYRRPLARPFPHGVPLGTTGASSRSAGARLLDLDNDFPNKFERRAEINRLKSKRRLEALDFGLLPYDSWSSYLTHITPRKYYLRDDDTYRYSYLYPTVISRYPVKPIRMVQIAPLSYRCIPMPDQSLDELTLGIEADEARIQAQHEAKRIQSALWQSEITDKTIRLCKERNRIRNQLRRIDNARMLAPIYSSPGTSLGTRHKVLINYHKGALGQQDAGRKTPDEPAHVARTESAIKILDEPVQQTLRQDSDRIVNGTSGDAADETSEIKSTFSVDQQQPLPPPSPPPPPEPAVEPQTEQKAPIEQLEVEIQQEIRPKKERKYDIHKEKKRKEEKKVVQDTAPEKPKREPYTRKAEKVAEPPPPPAEKEQVVEIPETPVKEPISKFVKEEAVIEPFDKEQTISDLPVKEEKISEPFTEEQKVSEPFIEEQNFIEPPAEEEKIIEPPAEEEKITEPPAEEQKIPEPPAVNEEVITEIFPKEEAPTIGLSAQITEPPTEDTFVIKSRADSSEEVEEKASTDVISEPSTEVDVEFKFNVSKGKKNVPESETVEASKDVSVTEGLEENLNEVSETIKSPALAKSQKSVEEGFEQKTTELHAAYEFTEFTYKTQSSINETESEEQPISNKPTEVESLRHDEDVTPSETLDETSASVTKVNDDQQAEDADQSPAVRRLISIPSCHEGDACDPSEWDDNESVDVESPQKAPTKKIILSASDDAIPLQNAKQEDEEKETITTKDRSEIEDLNVEPHIQEPDEETVKYDDVTDGYRYQSVIIDEND